MRKTAAIMSLVLVCLYVLNIGCNPKRNPTTPDITPVIPGISTPIPTLTAAAGCTLPDFAITGMAQGFSGVTIGCVEDYSHPGFIVYLKNQGCAAVTGAVSLNVNGVIINYAYNGGLAPGETENIWVENAPASGSMMSAIVDPSNNIAESDETNNSYQTYVLTLTPPPTCIQSPTNTPISTATSTRTSFVSTITATPTVSPTGSHTTGGPDLIVLSAITQLQFPHSCLNGDEGTVGTRVVIKNIGDADAVGFIDIEMEGRGTQQVTSAMSAGAERTVFFSGTSWPNNSVITVDSTSNIAEANESNNVFDGIVPICTPPPACTAQTSVTVSYTPTVTHTFTYTPEIMPTITNTYTPGCHLPLLYVTEISQNCTMPLPVSQCYDTYPNLGTVVTVLNGSCSTIKELKIKIGEKETFVGDLYMGTSKQVWVDTCTPIGEFDVTTEFYNIVTAKTEIKTITGYHGAIATAPPTCVNTPDITNTVTATTTISPTITMTPTITPAVACLEAKIKANYKYNELYTNINFTGSCVAANLQYKIAIYDGTNNLITTKTAYSGYGGVLTYNYTSTGSNNISAPWHVAIMLPSYNPPAVYNASDAGFEDVYEFTVMSSAPAPTPTLPCTNMVGVYHGQLTLIRFFNYKLNDCNAFTVKVDFCTENTRVALYDAGNNLLKTELLTCQTPGMSGLQMFYHIEGTEVPGIWHIDLYGESDTVPLVRTGAGTISSCPEGSLVVE